jgi:hypothetical protein
MKYIDRKDKYLCDSFQNEALENHKDERELREARRLWKKTRNKYLRKVGKKQTQNNYYDEQE